MTQEVTLNGSTGKKDRVEGEKIGGKGRVEEYKHGGGSVREGTSIWGWGGVGSEVKAWEYCVSR